MRSFDFPAYISFGKLDNAETIVTIELTDEEAQRVTHAIAEDLYFHLDECEAITDIYEKVYEAAVNQITQELSESDWCDDAKDPFWRADYLYHIGVNFPSNED